jgi:NADP-dependent 3-hydroxy acid dehydrogenase YdfG
MPRRKATTARIRRSQAPDLKPVRAWDSALTSMPDASSPCIFITGAAAGIGRATAELFAQRGWRLGLFDRDASGLDRVATSLGDAVCAMRPLDVTDRDDVAAAVSYFAGFTGGRMDVLFNCAGVLRCGPFVEQTAADDRLMIEVNLMGVLHGIRAALPLLEKTPGARIVTMSSSAAIHGVPEEAVYSASKFAVRALTEALSLELAPKGIKVSDVMPPIVRTGMVTEQAFTPAVNKNLSKWISAEDVAQVVWDAVHGHQVHGPIGRDVRSFWLTTRLWPGLGRRLMKRFSTHPKGDRPGGPTR